MDQVDQRKIRENYVELVRNLIPEDVMDYLYQERVLNEDDCENIRSRATRAQRMRLLLSILPKKKSDALSKLVTAMRNSGYDELVDLLLAPSTHSYSTDHVDLTSNPSSPSLCDTVSDDIKFLELREQLEHQSQVVQSMQQEMEQLQMELKRQSENNENNEKYKKTINILTELEKEKAEKSRVYEEIYKVLLQDVNKENECHEEGEKDSKSSTLRRQNRPQRQASFRTPSFTFGAVHHYAKIKCVLIGDGATGKTSIIHYFVNKQPLLSYVPTVFDNKTMNVTNGNTVVTVNFWDTAGQEDYDRLRPLSYSDSHVGILVFDVTSQSTLNSALAKWYPEFTYYCPKIPLVLVGNKKDSINDPEKVNELRKDGHRFVEAQEANKAAQVIKAKAGHAFLCSAMNGDGIQDLLDHIVDVGLRKMLKIRRKKHRCSLL